MLERLINSNGVIKLSQLLQDRKEVKISIVATKSNQPLEDGKGYEIGEEITPVSHLSPAVAKVSNVIENPNHDGGELQDACGGELQDRKEYEISSVITKSNQPLQDGKDYENGSVVTKSNQPLEDGKGYEIGEEITPVSPLSQTDAKDSNVVETPNADGGELQDRKEYEISSVVTKSNQLLQDGKEYEISEITPVSHLSPTDTEISNVVENPETGGGELQDACGGELQDAGGRALRDWCDLPDLVLFLILKRLTSLFDFFAFSHVCKEWRFISKTMKREYMATQPPLVCGSTSSRGFYSWKEERLYKKNQLALKYGRILGFSHGFLILLRGLRLKSSKKVIALVNPITGVEVTANFPLLPKCLKNRYAHASLTSPPTSPDCTLLLSDVDFIFLCCPGGLKWAVHPRDDERRDILCETFFKGKVYALSNKGIILIYDPSHHPKFTFLRAQNNPFSEFIHCSSTRLADCGGELFAIKCFEYLNHPRKVRFVVQRYDPTACMWVRLENLGNHALFLDRRRGAFWEDATNWGGSGNCIYYLSDSLDNEEFLVFHMEDGKVENISCPMPYCFPSCWVFPRLCS